MNKLNHNGLLVLEQPFIKVPLEQLKKTAKGSHKELDREFAKASLTVSELANKSNQEQILVSDANFALEGMVGRLQSLKRKAILNDAKVEEAMYVSRSKQRLSHLNELTHIQSANSEEYTIWSKVRLDRILVDYMLREGFSETATHLANAESIEAFVDVELFSQARRVEQALQRFSCNEALRWCNDNKSNLRKMQSTFEFNLRLQEFIELVRAGKRGEAILYAKKYLNSFQELHLKEIQRAMTLLAFQPGTKCLPYKKLYDASRWDALISQFRADNFALNSLTSQPLLTVTLQAGLSALKTPMCCQPDNKNINCPVCSPDTLGLLAQNLPLSHHVNSTIVCRLSGEIIDEDNPPMSLPNGYVYSLKALQDMYNKSGQIKCPRTEDVYDFSQLKKVYIS
ncbi:200_t:CDS:2 [Funneliformis mosseae]|uniref:200_t:CDS:1 n=1 Tax=Funneliformis mosseae TaxID=27381 RepID=A0A9N9FS30_FUNMO|nr:200_t:CDS:2 [Funneliformis mosseae]